MVVADWDSTATLIKFKSKLDFVTITQDAKSSLNLGQTLRTMLE